LPQIALQKIFRQSQESTIVDLADQMRRGILAADFRDKKADRSYFEAQAAFIPDMIQKIVLSAIKSGIPAEEIQILAPMYKGQAGINHLNQLMQNLLNPLEGQTEFLFNDTHFRKGDKVLHLVNDAQLNVFNGDIGYITDLIPAKYTESKQDELILDFDGSEVTYPRNEWLKLTLAYAMSIHKSQGSEFQVVILPITRQSGRLLQRNLIYTAITRSKSKLIMLGEIAAFDYAIKNEGDKRQTYLIERFQEQSDLASSQPDHELKAKEQTSLFSNTATLEDDSQKSSSQSTNSDPTENSQSDNDDFRLTPENYSTIDPMIGLTEPDITLFFQKKS
ncbi:MAG: ATP-binding domain-containing protein, partial [Streptococcus dysgalactiae]|nr:ATP-binding domain-containing protein [Streptococcus dysgalactiae]